MKTVAQLIIGVMVGFLLAYIAHNMQKIPHKMQCPYVCPYFL